MFVITTNIISIIRNIISIIRKQVFAPSSYHSVVYVLSQFIAVIFKSSFLDRVSEKKHFNEKITNTYLEQDLHSTVITIC